MSDLTVEEKVNIIEDNIKNLNDNSFKIYFFVLDTKGNPSGSLEYIYEMALSLKEKGYNVGMLHQEKEFIGVKDWMGERYEDIPHYNVETDSVEITASDFLIIPEILSNVMVQTKTMPCKRILLVQNYNYLSEFMPLGVTPDMLGVIDIITTTETQKQILSELFPNNRISVISPYIKNVFREKEGLKDLVINIVARDQSDVNRIVKTFYWKYPIYKWVSFRDLRGITQESLADALNNSIFTIWVDRDTNFGYTALQSLKCGSILLGKVPNTPPDWCWENKESSELTNACLWFDHMDDLPSMIATLVRSWTLDNIPREVYDNAKKLNELYTYDKFNENMDNLFVKKYFPERKKEFETIIGILKNNKENNK